MELPLQYHCASLVLINGTGIDQLLLFPESTLTNRQIEPSLLPILSYGSGMLKRISSRKLTLLRYESVELPLQYHCASRLN